MQRNFHLIPTLLTFFTLAACEFKNEVSSENPSTPPQPQSSEPKSKTPSEFVEAQVAPSAKPERYTVYISWPMLAPDQQMRVRLGGDLTVLAANKNFFTHEVSHNQTLLYQFEVLGASDKIVQRYQRQIKIPKDLWLKANSITELTGRHQVERLFLDAKATVRVGSLGLDIETKELYAEQVLIESFPQGQKASLNTKGRSAGGIAIKAGVARGTLTINLRGEHGGDGNDGPAHAHRASDGHRPTDGTQTCECRNHSCGRYKSIPKQNYTLLNPSFVEDCYCNIYGQPGGNGANGAIGHAGSPAQKGGDGGKVSVHVIDGSDFDLFVESPGGLAGTPGNGGPGQPGGFGGTLGPEHVCSGRFGKNGNPGPQGPRGATAPAGANGQICVFIASENRNECR